jgi:hypothetical protein
VFIEVCLVGLALFRSVVSYLVGQGTKVHFQLDWWCGEGVLKDVYPDLYGVARNKGL